MGDVVQTNGGNSIIIGDGKIKPSGEFGPAGRTFKNATNVRTDGHNGLFEDMHNSHNRVYEWIHKLPKQDER